MVGREAEAKAQFCKTDEEVPGKRPWPSNVWIGVSVETQAYIWRVSDLIQVPARVRFLSVEPLLGPVDLDSSLFQKVHWVIVGGESGHGARPMMAEWVYAIHEQCRRHHVKFFFKQWGAYTSDGRQVGKKAAGRVLNGRTWDEMPAAAEVLI